MQLAKVHVHFINSDITDNIGVHYECFGLVSIDLVHADVFFNIQ